MGGGKGGGLTRIDLPLTGATDATRSQNVMPTGTSARYRSKCRASRTAILQAQHALGFFDLAAIFCNLEPAYSYQALHLISGIRLGTSRQFLTVR